MLYTFKDCTLYTIGGFGYVKTECRTLTVTLKPIAQYACAIDLRYVAKRKRREEGYFKCGGVVVVAGHGQMDPPNPLTEPVREGAFTVTRSRHLSFDPAYSSEFDAALAASTAKILLDLRKHEAHAIPAPILDVLPSAPPALVTAAVEDDASLSVLSDWMAERMPVPCDPEMLRYVARGWGSWGKRAI